ncbi:MAG: metalloregulator ArsR/SmtB family transcription factor [Eggerthellaceae bacterium]
MDADQERLGTMLKTLAEPTRFKIVQLLLNRHHCSRSLALTLGISESAVSQHMAVLKKAGIVTGFRHSYHIHYVLNSEAVDFIIAQMNAWRTQMAQIEDCHELNPCEFVIDDGTRVGCLYRSQPAEDD